MHVENTITIDRPIEDVFAYLADGLNNPRWRPSVLSIEPASGSGGLGSRYRQKMRGPGGRTIDGDYEVTRFEPPRLFEFKVIVGPGRPTGVFTLSTPEPGRTSVTFSLDMEPTGMMRLMSGLVASTMQSEVDQLSTLKEVLEQAG